MATKEATAVARVEGPTEVSGLVALAIEKGVDVEVLERLVALQERVTERNARAAFFEALAAFQEEAPQIHKSRTAKIVSKRTGSQFSYSYAPLEDIARKIRPVLRKQGLSYHWDVPGVADGVMLVCCILRHVEGHEERSTFPVPVDAGSERMSAAQANGAALTYGKRQSLVAVLGLTTADEDVDGAAPESAEAITESQAADLRALMREVKADEPKFLGWLSKALKTEVRSVEEIPAARYREAITALEQKRRPA